MMTRELKDYVVWNATDHRFVGSCPRCPFRVFRSRATSAWWVLEMHVAYTHDGKWEAPAS